MKRTYKKALDGVRQKTPLLAFAEHGMSPDEIKQGIIDLLSPYFTNQGILEEMAIPVLAPEAVNVSRIEDDSWAKGMFTNILNEYRQAAALDIDMCFEGCAEWESQIQHGISEYWSGLYLEVDKSDLNLEDFKYEAFRNIGMVIEACLQPLLKELLLQVRIRKSKANPDAGLEALDLGLAVGELIDTSGYPELVAPPPWNIRLNQWRNMAQHHKIRVENGLIVGGFGKGSSEREVKFGRDELLNALKRIYSIFSVIKTARSIFLIDNIKEFKPRVKDIVMRADVHVLHLAASIATQGFELIDLTIEGNSVTAVIKDITDLPARERMLHASQFVYPVWFDFPLDNVTVEFLDRLGDSILTINAKGSDCDEVKRKRITSGELAGRVDLVLSEKGKSFFVERAT